MDASIKLDDDLKNRIQRLAERRHCSTDSVMREAIRDYVEREDAKEHFRQEALASMQAYQKTGRHLTGQEVREWLDNWGTDKETSIPPCHK